MENTWSGQVAQSKHRPSWQVLILTWGFRYRAWIGGIVLGPAGFLTLFGSPSDWTFDSARLTCRALGWATFLSGAAFRLWATFYVGGRKRAELVTSGPYSLCRNPLYVGSFLVALSVGLFLQSLLLLAAVGFTALGYVLTTVPSEERELLAVHPKAYADYCRRTSRFWPRFSLFQTAETVEISIPALRREAKRMCVWIWLPFACELVEAARHAPWWPHFHWLLG